MMFKNPFSFEGRIRRTEYGLSILIYSAAAFFINLVALTAMQSSSSAAILLVLYIPMVWFVWAQGAKRCHDRNNSGWFQIIPFYSLWMIFAEGDHGDNMYGADPKGRESTFAESNILDTPDTF